MRISLKVVLFTVCVFSCFASHTLGQQSDTSSYFPLGVWGIWIDHNTPPFSGDPNWSLEQENWTNLRGNYLVYWIPYWVQDTVIAFADANGYKTDIANWYYWSPNHPMITNSLYWWMGRPISDSAQVTTIINSIKSSYGSHQAFYNYTFGQEHLWDPGAEQDLWPKIELVSRKIQELDPERKSYWVSGGAPPPGFTDAVPHLDILQMDAYFFDALHGQNFNDQQDAFDDYLIHYDATMNRLREKHTEWQAIIQAHREERSVECPADLRRPNFYELRTQAYLALSRGARGITSFVYGSFPPGGGSAAGGSSPSYTLPPQHLLDGVSGQSILSSCVVEGYIGLVDENRDPYNQVTDPDNEDAFQNLANVHDELKSVGPILRKLRVYEAFPRTAIPTGNAAGVKYVSGSMIEIGTFKRIDQGSDSSVYFMVANRVCNNQDGSVSSPQNIAVQLDGGPWFIEDQRNKVTYSGTYDSGQDHTTFTVTLGPGEGRLFWMKDVEDLAFENRSANSTATAGNNQRKLFRESSGALHEVFESFDEIYYRFSPNDGASWTVTKRISDGLGSNAQPSITGRYNNYATFPYVVWQKGNAPWNIVYNYSTYQGTSWQSTPITLASNVDSWWPGPSPVIMAGTPSNPFELMIVYRTLNNLKSARTTVTTPSAGSWNTITVNGTNSQSRNPTLAYQSNSYGYFRLAWNDDNKIYASHFYGSSWSSSPTWVSSGAYLVSDQSYPSYVVTSNFNHHYVWDGNYSGRRTVIHNKNATSFYNVIQSGSNHYYRPNVSTNATYEATIAWYDNLNRVVNTSINSGYPITSGSILSSTGLYPSVSVSNPASGTAKVLWTGGSVSPYAIQFNNPTFQKTSGQMRWKQERIIVLRDDERQAELVVKVGRLRAVGPDGTEYFANFKSLPEDDSTLAVKSWEYLGSESFLLPKGAKVLELEYAVSARNISVLGSGMQLTVEMFSTAGSNLAALAQTDVLEGSMLEQSELLKIESRKVLEDLSISPHSARFTLSGIREIDSTCTFSLLNIFEELPPTSGFAVDISIPETKASGPIPVFHLAQNYPNPFNPTTEIRFDLPDNGNVRVVVFDVLGRRVKTLLNEFKSAGNYSINFDGADIPSGIYFYRLEYGEQTFVRRMQLVK
ncbi:MAG: T9SS type A sorting domain-containing protein [Bacteroidota bacterium]